MPCSIYKVLYSNNALHSLSKMDKFIAKSIQSFIAEISQLENPKLKAKPLKSNLSGFYRFRFKDYRIICEINDTELCILLLEIGHRKNIYNLPPLKS